MKIAFDVDVLSKQMSINDLVHQVADWGYKYIEQSPHPRINPFYKHPLFSKECEEEYRKALKETGVEISSFICVYRWSGPTEEQRKMAVANWKKMIEIAVNMGVPVINTELSGDPNQPEICEEMFYRSMEELLSIFEREGLRVAAARKDAAYSVAAVNFSQEPCTLEIVLPGDFAGGVLYRYTESDRACDANGFPAPCERGIAGKRFRTTVPAESFVLLTNVE